jgi:hypothetical protein
MTCYPDGLDLPTDLTKLTWMSHYMTSEKELKSVTIDEDRLNEIKDIINAQKSRSKAMIVNSHVHIYDFIMKNMPKFEACSIYNIDMHHDLFNNSEKLDCGNWISHVKEDIENCNITWIANEASDDIYGVKNLPIEHDFKSIKDKKFDLIFLCRSDTWLPPHLDPYFDDLYNVIIKKFHTTIVDPQIKEPRNMDDIYEHIKMIKGFDENFIKQQNKED